MVAVGGGHAPMEETGDDSNGGGPEGKKDMDSLVVENGVRYQCSGSIKSFNAGVEFRDTLVLEEGEDDDDDDGGDGDGEDGDGGGGDGGGGDDGDGGDGAGGGDEGVFVATRECTTSEDDLEEESDEED